MVDQPPKESLTGLARQGVELCRQGSWKQGLVYLAKVAEARESQVKVPSLVYSYLGYGIGRFENRIRDGVSLCEHAVKLGFYEADNYFNLARTHLLRESRRAAVKAVRQGLSVDPEHGGLIQLQRELGVRRQPILPFLGRRNALNRFLGQLRQAFFPPRGGPPGVGV